MSIIFRLKTTTLIGQNSAATQIDINSLMLGNYRENLKVQRLNFCKKKKSKLQEITDLGEDGAVGRPRAHILSKAHQKHN